MRRLRLRSSRDASRKGEAQDQFTLPEQQYVHDPHSDETFNKPTSHTFTVERARHLQLCSTVLGQHM